MLKGCYKPLEQDTPGGLKFNRKKLMSSESQQSPHSYLLEVGVDWVTKMIVWVNDKILKIL
jgi:hypothetical protein